MEIHCNFLLSSATILILLFFLSDADMYVLKHDRNNTESFVQIVLLFLTVKVNFVIRLQHRKSMTGLVKWVVQWRRI